MKYDKILITGASSGIGRELARRLAPQCGSLVLVGRDRDRLEALREELASGGCSVTAVSADLSRRESCQALFADHPVVDLLINNAGFGDFGPFWETSLDKELNMIDTNIKGLHTMMKLYLPAMMERDRGHILNVASIAGFLPGPLMATYYATKAYVVRLTEGVRKELRARRSHVRLSLLCPGPVQTGFAGTANIAFHFNGADAGKTADYVLAHLDRFYIVPGLSVRLARCLVKAVPASLAASAVYLIQSKRRA